MIVNKYGREKDYREQAGAIGKLFLRFADGRKVTKLYNRYVKPTHIRLVKKKQKNI